MCIYCGYSLSEHFAALEAQQQARVEAPHRDYIADLRRKRLYLAGSLVFGGILLMSKSAQASSDASQHLMLVSGFGLFLLGALVHFGSLK